MLRHNVRRSEKAGLPPGSMVHIGEKLSDETRITVIDYHETQFTQKDSATVEDLANLQKPDTVTWVNVHGLSDLETLQKIGATVGLHPLVLEDIVATDQRPKLEDFGNYLFVVLKWVSYEEPGGGIVPRQVSLIIGPSYLISFQEKEEGAFHGVRDRIQAGTGRARTLGADYLAYALIDTLVDHYFVTLEAAEDDLEELEETVVTDPGPEALQNIHRLKGDMIALRKSIWPLREVIGALERGETPLIKDETQVYFRDVYDHTIQIMDTIETFRDILAGMLDVYLSSVSNRMNEVMKVLTIIATLFMPASFVAGVYGMNLKNIPETQIEWGYPLFWGIIVVITVIMLRYFRKKKWL